jgi:polysaccharide export outer membrane protein
MSNIKGCCKNSMFKSFFYPFFFVVFALCLFSSCKTVKPTAYFQTLNRDTAISQFMDTSLESKIVKNDVLAITVSSLNKMEDALYNESSLSSTVVSGSYSPVSSQNTSSGQGYVVDVNGNIQLHNIGKLHVEGLTRKQLKDTLEISLLPYLKDPIITVNFLNKRVTILGEVIKPQVLQIQEERISLLDALSLSGDVTMNALKRDILVIRTTPQGKTFKHVNLENESIFRDSNWYYLQSEDIVYVEPNLRKLINQDRRTRLQVGLSITSIALTVILLIVQLTH